jgi:hypothetical protein
MRYGFWYVTFSELGDSSEVLQGEHLRRLGPMGHDRFPS